MTVTEIIIVLCSGISFAAGWISGVIIMKRAIDSKINEAIIIKRAIESKIDEAVVQFKDEKEVFRMSEGMKKSFEQHLKRPRDEKAE